VDATISKSGEFRFVGDEAFELQSLCFVSEPERDCCGSHR